MKIDTFVYYVIINHESGDGRTEVKTSKRIDSIDVIKELENYIESTSEFKNVMVKNFVLLDSYNSEERENQNE